MIFKDVNNMETNTIIAEILKDKPKGTKLYSPLFGDVYLSYVKDGIINVQHHVGITKFFGNGRYYNYPESEPLLFPSKEMQDWSKFAWEKGDVLVNKIKTIFIIFEGFEDDNYTTFKGKHCLTTIGNEKEYTNKESNFLVSLFDKAKEDDAQTYIKRLGGKLNRETLEIEKQPEFKDGDILCVIDNSDDYHYILIYKGQDKEHIYRYVTMFEDNSLHIRKDATLTKPEDYSMRYATDEEKQQLFDALAKEGKAWDAEKKQIVNLKPKSKFEPFDKVLVRDCLDEMWRPSFFACYLPFGREPYQVIDGEWVKLCIPYEGNESLLGTTKDVEG